MARRQKTAADLNGGGSGVNKTGKYHCVVVRSAEDLTTKGNVMSGVSSVLSVLDGDHKDQIEKEIHLHLFDPDMNKTEEIQNYALQKQTAFAVAINQLDPSKLGEDAEIEYVCDGAQLIVEIGNGNKKNDEGDWVPDPTSFELKFSSIYHVDDPRVASVPKSADAIALLKPEARKEAKYFDALCKKKIPAIAPRIDDDALAGL